MKAATDCSQASYMCAHCSSFTRVMKGTCVNEICFSCLCLFFHSSLVYRSYTFFKMPRVQSISAAKATSRRGKSKAAQLVDAITTEEAEASFAEYEEDEAIAKDTSSVATKKLRVRIQLTRLLHRWYKHMYSDQVAERSNQDVDEENDQNNEDDNDGGLWSLGCVGLCRVLEHFLSWKVKSTVGLAGKGKPLVRTVKEWRDVLLWALIEFVGDRKTVVNLLRGTLYNKSDGVFYRLHRHVSALQVRHNLPTRGKEKLYYGRGELVLFLSELKRRMNTSPFSNEQTLQQEILLKIAFFTGCRPGAFAQSDKGDTTLNCSDIKIHQISRFNYCIEIDFHNIKGFRNLGGDAYCLNFMLKPVSKVKNVVFDLSVAFIPFCIGRGILYDDHRKRLVTDIVDVSTMSGRAKERRKENKNRMITKLQLSLL